jgi:hypothetical protein
MFDDCVRVEDFKTHAKKFCFQYSNPFIHEKELYLSMSFLAFLSKPAFLKENDVFCNGSILHDAC